MQPWNIIIFCPIDMQFHIYKHHMIQIKNGTATVYGNTKLALIPIFPMLCVCENPEWINRHEKWLLLPGLQTYDGGWSLFIHWKCKYHHCHSAHNAKYEIKAQGLIMRQFYVAQSHMRTGTFERLENMFYLQNWSNYLRSMIKDTVFDGFERRPKID